MAELTDLDIVAILYPETPVVDWAELPAAEIAAYRAGLIRAEEERQAAFLAVEETRPLEYVNFLIAPKEHVLLWIEHHGDAEAFWAIICVLRYLVACKDRAKYQ